MRALCLVTEVTCRVVRAVTAWPRTCQETVCVHSSASLVTPSLLFACPPTREAAVVIRVTDIQAVATQAVATQVTVIRPAAIPVVTATLQARTATTRAHTAPAAQRRRTMRTRTVRPVPTAIHRLATVRSATVTAKSSGVKLPKTLSNGQRPCPSTGKSGGACPGYVIDHVRPLECGGADAPSNMQWQTIAAGKAKDNTERSCR